ncbi:hypothetical protein BJ165DRAFT_1443765 [Panaeolus papilionaceus]|nr:hypothetical protein BJ165DRAFT_1443765 [Panaeolus papilionaceus]
MCYLLHVCHRYHRCNHNVLQFRQKIECNSKTCTISASHERKPHDCAGGCLTRMKDGQTIIQEQFPDVCDDCRLNRGR